MSLLIATTFPFLCLPTELRLMVYENCFDLSGVDKWFGKYWNVLRARGKLKNTVPPFVYLGTPTVFLICKQVYHEVCEVFKRQSISFHHGLLNVTGLNNLMTSNILNKIGSLTIDAKGHEVLPTGRLMGPSWRGHLNLIVDISSILAKGHQLRAFTLDLTDKDLHEHVHECCHKTIRCDFRDQIKEALGHLRKVRSIPNVNLIGIPEAMIKPLKARMQSNPLTFLNLPGEIRNQIYDLSADWSDISIQLTRTMKTWSGSGEKKSGTPIYPPRTTPTILLLNKQIHAEAKTIIHAKPLKLTMPVDASMKMQTDTLNALRLISVTTLPQIQHLHIRVESWEWVYALDRLLPNLGKKHNLQSFRFTFVDALKKTFLRQRRSYPDLTLHTSLGCLLKVRGVPCVEFGGDLPEVYTAPLKVIMESAEVEGEVLPARRAIKIVSDGFREGLHEYEVVDVDEEATT